MSQTTDTPTATAMPVGLFPNDFTNIIDREEQKRKREEEARLVAAAAERERNRTKGENDLREEIESLKKQLAGLEVDKKNLESKLQQETTGANKLGGEVERLQKQLAGLGVDNKNLESKLQQETTRANKLEGEKNSAQTDAQQQKNRAAQFENERNQLQNEKLDPKNNLDPSYHGKLVMIVNIASRSAIDFGKANNSEVWAFEWNWGNPNQRLQLFKVDQNDKNSAWRIKCAGNGKWLHSGGYNQCQVPWAYNEQDINPPQWGHYYIGSAKAGEYVFENYYSKRALDQPDTSRGGAAGKTLFQYDRLANSHQSWNIIRMEPDA